MTQPPNRPISLFAPAVRRRARRRAALRDEVWQGPGSSAWRARLAAERRAERRTYALVAALAFGLGAGGAIAWGAASGEPHGTADRAAPVATKAR